MHTDTSREDMGIQGYTSLEGGHRTHSHTNACVGCTALKERCEKEMYGQRSGATLWLVYKKTEDTPGWGHTAIQIKIKIVLP